MGKFTIRSRTSQSVSASWTYTYVPPVPPPVVYPTNLYGNPFETYLTDRTGKKRTSVFTLGWLPSDSTYTPSFHDWCWGTLISPENSDRIDSPADRNFCFCSIFENPVKTPDGQVVTWTLAGKDVTRDWGRSIFFSLY